MKDAFLEIELLLPEPGMTMFKTALSQKHGTKQIREFIKKTDLKQYLLSLSFTEESARKCIKKTEANGSVRINILS